MLLCTDYKLLSKVLANRLKDYLQLLVHKDQYYCIPERTIMDNVFIMRDLLEVCKTYSLNIGILSLDTRESF